MSHATEGELHAYLDGALPAIDPAAAGRLAAHLDRCIDCQARLEEERSLRARAGELLGIALPAVDAPPFETLPGATGERGPRGARPRRLRWAASVVVALGAGWMGHALLGGDPGVAPPETAMSEVAAPGPRGEAPRDEAPRDEAPRDAASPEPETDWREVSLDEAERWVATRALRVPDLEVIAVEAAVVGGRRVIRLRQALPGGAALELVQEAEVATGTAEAAEAVAGAPAEAFAERQLAAKAALSLASQRVRIGGVWVTASAPLASDSLRALVSRIHQ